MSRRWARLSRTAVALDVCIVLPTVGQVVALSRIVESVLLVRLDVRGVLPTAVWLIGLTATRACLLGARDSVGSSGSY